MVRLKHRYILAHIIFPKSNLQPPSPITESALVRLLRDSLNIHFGSLGAGEVNNIVIKYLSNTTHTVVLRIGREHVRKMAIVLCLLRRIADAPCIVRVLHISGTIRKITHKAIELNRKEILRRYATDSKRDSLLIKDKQLLKKMTF